MKTLLILQGLPGSGKSTWTKACQEDFKEEGKKAIIASADSYFESEIDGTYKFFPEGLGEAHRQCRAKTYDALRDERTDIIFVDNTNLSLWEVDTYYHMGKEVGARMCLIRFDCSLETALARNTHRVPQETMERMEKKLQAFQLPEDWEIGILYLSQDC